MSYYHFIAKSQNNIDEKGRGGRVVSGLGGGGGEAVCDMCADLYQCHYKSMNSSAPAVDVGVGRGAGLVLVVGVDSGLGGGQNKCTLNCSLATAQHLCSTLVGLVDPGLVGIGLKRVKQRLES